MSDAYFHVTVPSFVLDLSCTVPTNMIAYMWNTDRKPVIVRIIDALTAVKSVTGLPYRHLQGSEDAVTYQCVRHGNAAARVVPFKVKCTKHMFPKGSAHH